ncbi:MAG: hypothetical protein LBD74_06950 [Spirochaetaceae bacterium]|jgi:diaminopimelate epimerase|nr:hypothetical protein [Spirochaetaceae bacterium]
MQYEIVIADPAKNITILVLSPVEDRAEAAKALLGLPGLGAEQVGFVLPPKAGELWRLEMMGGEFCGNAARSFGLWVAQTQGYGGVADIPISISGMPVPLTVRVDTQAGTAAVAMPRPQSQTPVLLSGGLALPVYAFAGITHVIVPGISVESQRKTWFQEIKAQIESRRPLPQALGVLFYDRETAFMTPWVYVYATDSLVAESSCGSGSAALGAWRYEALEDGEEIFPVVQPGGVIEVRIWKCRGKIREIAIGGPVSFHSPPTATCRGGVLGTPW